MKICLKCEKPSSVQGEQKCIHCGGMLVEASVLEKFKNAATIRAPKSLHQEVQSFGPQVKQGLITVAGAIFLAVLSAGITFFVQRSVYVKENDRLKNDSRDLQMDNATLRAKINDRTDELQKTRTERDEAQEELAPWIQLANTQLTNTPLSERLDKLLDILRADLGARSRSVANLPLIYVTSMLGHPTSWTNNPDYRLHSLVVRNESDVEINNFCSRLQLPEPILQTLMTNCIVGVSVNWRPLLLQMLTTGTAGRTSGGMWVGPGSAVSFVYPPECFFPQGLPKHGQQTEHSGAGDTTGIWELTIDRLPPRGYVSLEFLTSNGPGATNYMRFAATPLCQLSPMTPPDTNELKFYLEGQYWYQGDTNFTKQQFLVPIMYEARGRAFSSSTVQSNLGRWHPTIMNLY